MRQENDPPGGWPGGPKAEYSSSTPQPTRRVCDPGWPHAYVWLATDNERWARRAFADTVVHAGLPDDELVARCDLYATRWLVSGLVGALEAAHQRRPLPPAARRLLAAYTEEGVAA